MTDGCWWLNICLQKGAKGNIEAGHLHRGIFKLVPERTE